MLMREMKQIQTKRLMRTRMMKVAWRTTQVLVAALSCAKPSLASPACLVRHMAVDSL